MTPDQVQEIVEDAINPMAVALRLSEWSIDFVHRRLDGKAEITVHPAYRDAAVSFDADNFETDAQVRRTLRHELLHLMHADLTGMRDGDVGEDGGTFESNVRWQYGVERLVWSLERMLDAQGLTPEALIEAGRKELGE